MPKNWRYANQIPDPDALRRDIENSQAGMAERAKAYDAAADEQGGDAESTEAEPPSSS